MKVFLFACTKRSLVRDAMKKSEDFMGTCQETIVDHCCTVSISRRTSSSLSVPSTVTETQHELDCSLQ